MAEARRLPLVAGLAALLVFGTLWGGSGAGSGPAPAAPPALSGVASAAISSSWSCAGATAYPDSLAAGTLLFSNAGTRAVSGQVQLVTQVGYRRTVDVTVPAGGVSTLPETMPGLAGSNSDHWVGALVTLYGPLTTVDQVLTTARGSTSQPCASGAARQWYFPDGATLRNAWDEISLLNPYTVPAVADLSFTTELGQEAPIDFLGIGVPAEGLTVVDLGSHLRRRQHIAVTVSVRRGEVVAFQTQVVTPPPAGAPPRGTPGAVNPVLPVPGTSLLLGSPAPARSLWWPTGGQGPGLTESYAVYNPTGQVAHLQLVLKPATGARSSVDLVVGPHGTSFVTTNGAPWALPGSLYSAHLQSENGVPVTAERVAMLAPPAGGRGLAVLLGEGDPSRSWMVVPGAAGLTLPEQFLGLLGPDRLELLGVGAAPATASVEVADGRGLVPLAGDQDILVEPGVTTTVEVPASFDLAPLVVESSGPILAEQDWSSPLPSLGTSLAPVAALASP